MADQITFYFDYACPFTFRARRWLQDVEAAGRVLAITWKTFSLKEANRSDAPSVFDQPSDDVGLLRLSLAKAAQAAGSDVFQRFHTAMYEAVHGTARREQTTEYVLAIAAEAGLDVNQFGVEQRDGVWLQAVAHDHREAVSQWHAFGVPTLVFADQQARFLKFNSIPETPAAAAALFDHLHALLFDHAGLVEIKQP